MKSAHKSNPINVLNIPDDEGIEMTPEIDLLVKYIKDRRLELELRLHDDDAPGHWTEPGEDWPKDEYFESEFVHDDTEQYRLINAQIDLYDELIEEIKKIYGWNFDEKVTDYSINSPVTGIQYNVEVLKNRLGDTKFVMSIESEYQIPALVK